MKIAYLEGKVCISSESSNDTETLIHWSQMSFSQLSLQIKKFE